MNRIQALLRSPRHLKWLFYGDSITHGACTFGGRDYTEHFSERVRAEMERPLDIVIKTALSGNSTRELLAGFNWRVEQFRPDVVFIMIGMNDCKEEVKMPLEEFQANLEELCRRVLAMEGAIPVLQTANPITPGMAPNREPRFDPCMDIVRRVAADQKIPLVDHHAFWKQMERENPGKIRHWMSDELHPNRYGHIAFAHHLFKLCGIFDERSTVCRLFHP